MESSSLPALRPSKAVVEAIVSLLVDEAGERLQRGAANWDGTEEDTWWKDYHDEWLLYSAAKDRTIYVDSAIASITRSGRKRTSTNMSNHQIHRFDSVEVADLDDCTLQFGCFRAGVELLEVKFQPSGCFIRLTTNEWESEEKVGPLLTVEQVEAALQTTALPWGGPPKPPPLPQFRVFIGHGGDSQWRDLRDALRDHHGFDVEAFERSPRAGQVIRDVLQSMVAASSAGVLVLTKANQQADGSWQGRQNVVHEIGYVQGALGWDRAIVVVEEGVVLPSNLDGTQQIRFSPSRIREAEGQVAAVLRILRDTPARMPA